MRARVVFVVVAVLAVVFTLRLSIHKSPSPTNLSSKFGDKVYDKVDPLTPRLSPMGEKENTASARKGVLPVPQDAVWRSHLATRAFKPNEAAFAAFADW